jgi:stage II sporulation protein AA (anti-sigma F factor antagonist)
MGRVYSRMGSIAYGSPPLGDTSGMTWKLTIRREAVAGAVVLRIHGRLGTATSGDLLEAIVRAIREGDRRLVLDLTEVDYASSAGLLVLDAAAGRMHEAGGTLILCEVSEPVRLVMELAGLLPHFDLKPSVKAAVEPEP